MKITWLGHGSFRIEIDHQVLLIDPWLTGNPSFPDDRRAEALDGASQILLTHAHGDHASEIVAIHKETGAPLNGMFDLIEHWQQTEGVEGTGFNKGGTITFGDVKVTMVTASHSNSADWSDADLPVGSEVGYMISGEGRTIYFSGDTDIMADMDWMGDYHKPDIGILSAGGFFTMDMKRAAYAAKRYFDFKVVIPGHYGTFGALESTADDLKAGLPGVDVRTPGVMETFEL